MIFNTDNLNPMNLARLNAALDKLYRWSDGVRSLRDQLNASDAIEKVVFDGACDWNRIKFNRMDAKQQRAYEAKLAARRYYTIGGVTVPKLVFDAAVLPTRDSTSTL